MHCNWQSDRKRSVLHISPISACQPSEPNHGGWLDGLYVNDLATDILKTPKKAQAIRAKIFPMLLRNLAVCTKILLYRLLIQQQSCTRQLLGGHEQEQHSFLKPCGMSKLIFYIGDSIFLLWRISFDPWQAIYLQRPWILLPTHLSAKWYEQHTNIRQLDNPP